TRPTAPSWAVAIASLRQPSPGNALAGRPGSGIPDFFPLSILPHGGGAGAPPLPPTPRVDRPRSLHPPPPGLAPPSAFGPLPPISRIACHVLLFERVGLQVE